MYMNTDRIVTYDVNKYVFDKTKLETISLKT